MNVNRFLILLAVFLVSAVLCIDFPKSSTYLFSDEASYYSMAMSLARDQDLVYEPRDLVRIYGDWHAGPQGIFLKKSESGTLYFAKSYLYPLISVPFIIPFGINGFLLLNAVLLLTGILFSYLFLAGYPDRFSALVWVLTFYLFSTAYLYVFWIHPEMLNMCLLAACFYYWFKVTDRWETGGLPSWDRMLFQTTIPVAGLALLTFSKITFAVFMIPLFIYPIMRFGKRTVVYILILSIVFSVLTAVLFAGNYLATGTFNYQGGNRKSYVHEFPGERNNTFDSCGYASTTSTLEFTLDIPRTARNLYYFIFGRFAGIFHHSFPALICVFLFFSQGIRRIDLRGFLVFIAILLSVLTFVILIPYNYFGGNGALGNRYFISYYPAFLFLSRRVPGRKLIAVTWITGSLFLGPMIMNPMHHAFRPAEHAFSRFYRIFPVELTQIETLPIHVNHHLVESVFPGPIPWRAYFFDYNSYMKECKSCDGFWIKGGEETQLAARVKPPVRYCQVKVTNANTANRVKIRFENLSWTIDLTPDESRSIEIPLTDNTGFRFRKDILYRISISSSDGTVLQNGDARFKGCYVVTTFHP